MSTALIILNYNNSSDTRGCILSVLRHNTAPVRFIVVDNGSRPDEVEALKGVMAECFGSDSSAATLLLLPENVGYARGNNAGLQLAYDDPSVDRVMILNNDVLFIEDIIPGLIEAQDSLVDCAIITPILYKRDGESFDINCARRQMTVGEMVEYNFLFYWWVLRHRKLTDVHPDRYLLNSIPLDGAVHPIELPSGSCMLIRKDLFREIGSFDPATFLYFEENILYEKTRRKGLRNYLCTGLRCIHLGAATTDALPDRIHLLRHSMNSAKYFLRNYTDASLPARLLHSLSCSFYIGIARLSKLLK